MSDTEITNNLQLAYCTPLVPYIARKFVMNKNFTSALIVAAAALTGALSNATAASAFDWDSSWQPRQIFSKAQAGFNDQPFQK
jgi:hypothetical protein